MSQLLIHAMTPCPACQSGEAIEGCLLPAADDSTDAHIYPDGLKRLAFSRSVPLKQGYRFKACPACGHVWSQLSPESLRQLLERHGKGG